MKEAHVAAEPGQPDGHRTRPVWRLAGALTAISCVLTVVLVASRWCDSRSLDIDNRTGSPVTIYAHTDGMDGYLGYVTVEPRSSDTLRSSLFWEQADYIWITSNVGSYPQRHWTCRWVEVAAKGGLVWTDEGANCGEEHF